MSLAKNLLLLIVSSVLVAVCLSEDKKLVVGERQLGDKLERSETVSEEYNIFGKKVIVEKWFNVTTPGHVITQVIATNQVTDGTGAEVTLYGGGPNNPGVKLRFKSQRWHGVYYKVEIYGQSASYSAIYT
ncbi:hypothetical protein QAD02_010013 [Eretmocerus hayati]|uniref:Uncharacterized protein n=1 Tax=Eretmocerus hayati TaxID=131215 RepID=A0ACC2NAY8_9HYME|nr:hypothetical protein QAD02_010013 [Eretmocerus hayati]